MGVRSCCNENDVFRSVRSSRSLSPARCPPWWGRTGGLEAWKFRSNRRMNDGLVDVNVRQTPEIQEKKKSPLTCVAPGLLAPRLRAFGSGDVAWAERAVVSFGVCF